MLIITQCNCDCVCNFLPLLLDFKLLEGIKYVLFNTKQPYIAQRLVHNGDLSICCMGGKAGIQRVSIDLTVIAGVNDQYMNKVVDLFCLLIFPKVILF